MISAFILLGVSACHDPYEFEPMHYDTFFTSVTAYFPDSSEDVFPAEIDNVNHVVTIVVPYTYPYNTDSYLEMEDLSRMKVLFNLNKGYIITPGIPAFVDLSQDNHFTVIDNYGVSTPFTLRGEIRKGDDCLISEFTLALDGLSGEIDHETGVISFYTPETLTPQTAIISLPHGATIEPDPRTEALVYDENLKVTVTAQNGIAQKEYTFRSLIPNKLLSGIREGSSRIAWAKKVTEVGLVAYTGADFEGSNNNRFKGSAGLAVVDDKLLINDAGTGKVYVLNYRNGETIETIDVSALGTNTLGHYNNWRMTSDNHGNIMFASSPWNNDGSLTIWKMKGIHGQLEKIITYANGSAIGNQLSITGNADGDAIITSSQNGGGAIFYRWIVRNGIVQDQTPEIIAPPCYTANSWGCLDVVYLDTDENSEYISVGYAGNLDPTPPGSSMRGQEGVERTCVWHKSSSEVKSYGSQLIGVNSVENAGDIAEFNNAKFYAHNILNTLGYAADGNSLRMYNISSGDLSVGITEINDLVKNKYGSQQGSGISAKSSNGNDVRFFATPDGYFLYLFFEFCNGYVGGIRFDCIDMEN